MQKPFIPALLFVLLAFIGCTKSDTALKSTDTWYVSYFLDSGDKVADTGLFAGYTFEFNDDDVWLIHLPGGSTVTGKWRIDAASNTASFGMDNPSAPLSALLGNWEITEQLDTDLKLLGKLDTGSSALDEIPVLEFKKQ